MPDQKPKSSLSAISPPPSLPHRLPSDPSLIRPTTFSICPIIPGNKAPSITEPLTINVFDSLNGAVPGVLHLPSDYSNRSQSPRQRLLTAAILVSGASGGLVGPSSIYLGAATKLSNLDHGIPVLRLDYRYPARNKYCVADLVAAMNHLETTYAISHFVLIGWSFGGAPVFTVAGNDSRVIGCATVASQTADTEGIRKLAPRPLLLLHGLNDQTLDSWCSEQLYEWYGKDGERELKLFEGDDHALTRNANEVEERLCRFVMRCAGVKEGEVEGGIVKGEVVDGKERVRLMQKAGDLGSGEHVE
ncbi:MAG: hypothetical protein Q9186_006530 [Xanthomendoza sp. 1 TL-2023]